MNHKHCTNITYAILQPENSNNSPHWMEPTFLQKSLKDMCYFPQERQKIVGGCTNFGNHQLQTKVCHIFKVAELRLGFLEPQEEERSFFELTSTCILAWKHPCSTCIDQCPQRMGVASFKEALKPWTNACKWNRNWTGPYHIICPWRLPRKC